MEKLEHSGGLGRLFISNPCEELFQGLMKRGLTVSSQSYDIRSTYFTVVFAEIHYLNHKESNDFYKRHTIENGLCLFFPVSLLMSFWLKEKRGRGSETWSQREG